MIEQGEWSTCDGPIKPGLVESPALSWNLLHTPIFLCPWRRQPHKGHALGKGALQQSLTLKEPMTAGSLLTAIPTAGQRTLRREIWVDGGAGRGPAGRPIRIVCIYSRESEFWSIQGGWGLCGHLPTKWQVGLLRECAMSGAQLWSCRRLVGHSAVAVS